MKKSITAVPLESLLPRDRQEIDDQVERILRHPLFQGSKRIPVFLRHVVEESLKGNGATSVKERTLGVEVFGRKPDYDNNSDPIVRVTATELRKKLAQYYVDAGTADHIRIELPPGSYVARFRRMVEEAADEPITPMPAEADLVAVPLEPPVFPPVVATIDSSSAAALSPAIPARRPPGLWIGAGIALLVTSWILLLVLFLHGRNASEQPGSASLDLFWNRLRARSNHILIVLPVVGSDNTKHADAPGSSVTPNLTLEDTDVAARLASQTERHGMQFQFTSARDVALDRLQTEPAVLVGALDNVWSIRLMQGLPMTFEEAPDHRTGLIRKNNGPQPTTWTVDIDQPHSRISHDFGIVARFTSRLTGQPVILVAGISSQGTQAAGRLLTTPEIEALRDMPETSGNFEALLETDAVDGHAGQPHIIAVERW